MSLTIFQRASIDTKMSVIAIALHLVKSFEDSQTTPVRIPTVPAPSPIANELVANAQINQMILIANRKMLRMNVVVVVPSSTVVFIV